MKLILLNFIYEINIGNQIRNLHFITFWIISLDYQIKYEVCTSNSVILNFTSVQLFYA